MAESFRFRVCLFFYYGESFLAGNKFQCKMWVIGGFSSRYRRNQKKKNGVTDSIGER